MDYFPCWSEDIGVPRQLGRLVHAFNQHQAARLFVHRVYKGRWPNAGKKAVVYVAEADSFIAFEPADPFLVFFGGNINTCVVPLFSPEF